MAFTDAEKDSIQGYLGLPLDPETVARVQAAIAFVEASSVAESRIRAYLTTIAAIETQIATARNTAGSPYSQLLSEAQRQVYMIANALGMRSDRKVF